MKGEINDYEEKKQLVIKLLESKVRLPTTKIAFYVLESTQIRKMLKYLNKMYEEGSVIMEVETHACYWSLPKNE